MCLSIPGKVVSLEGNRAKIDYGSQTREARTDLCKPKVGDHVLVQAGLVTEILKPKEAREMCKVCAEASLL